MKRSRHTEEQIIGTLGSRCQMYPRIVSSDPALLVQGAHTTELRVLEDDNVQRDSSDLGALDPRFAMPIGAKGADRRARVCLPRQRMIMQSRVIISSNGDYCHF
jgi:hypothetical protein